MIKNVHFKILLPVSQRSDVQASVILFLFHRMFATCILFLNILSHIPSVVVQMNNNRNSICHSISPKSMRLHLDLSNLLSNLIRVHMINGQFVYMVSSYITKKPVTQCDVKSTSQYSHGKGLVYTGPEACYFNGKNISISCFRVPPTFLS